jgi:hypothetical protein
MMGNRMHHYRIFNVRYLLFEGQMDDEGLEMAGGR